MDVTGTSIGQAVATALEAKNENTSMQVKAEVLRRQLDATEASAGALLKMMGVGQNLDAKG